MKGAVKLFTVAAIASSSGVASADPTQWASYIEDNARIEPLRLPNGRPACGNMPSKSDRPRCEPAVETAEPDLARDLALFEEAERERERVARQRELARVARR